MKRHKRGPLPIPQMGFGSLPHRDLFERRDLWFPISRLSEFERPGQEVVVGRARAHLQIWGRGQSGWFTQDSELRDPTMFSDAVFLPLPRRP